MNILKKCLSFDFSQTVLNRFSLFIGLFTATVLLVTISYWGTTYSDDMEHLHASWLIWSGKLPYRDFFEHHHPLLWFLFAPITGLLYNQAIILYVGSFVSWIASLATWFFIYKIITLYIADVKVWIFTLVCLIFFSIYDQGVMIEFRPDVYMYLCFWAGLYYYFSYLKSLNYRLLAISATLFTLSFLFLQKILLLLLVLSAFSLYLLKKKKMKWLDVGKSLIIPFLLMSGFALYLILSDSFENYWKLNLELNTLMAKHYGFTLHTFHNYLGNFFFATNTGYAAVNFSFFSTVLCVLAFMAIPFFWQKKSYYRQCLAILFISEFFIRMLTFSSYFIYFYLLHILGLIIITTVGLSLKSKIINFFFGMVLLLYMFAAPNFLLNTRPMMQTKSKFISDLQYILDNSAPEDILLNGYLFHFNLFRQDADYVWFGVQDIGYIYDLYYAQPRYDLNKIIEDKKPKFIYTVNYENIPYRGRFNVLKKFNMNIMALYQSHPDPKYAVRDLLASVPEIYAQTFDMEMVKKHYQPTEIENLWIRKDDNKK